MAEQGQISLQALPGQCAANLNAKYTFLAVNLTPAHPTART